MRRRPALVLLALLAAPQLRAQEDRDLALNPILETPAPATPPPAGRLFVEEAATAWSQRAGLTVPLPSAPVEQWENRTSLDARREWRLSPSLTLAASDRVSLIEQSDVDLPSHGTIRNDLREAYVTWEPMPQTYVEAGRLNVKHGEALGFNPTDFFRRRSAVELASLDPSALRDNRLGTAMVRAETIFAGGALALVAAPRLAAPAPLAIGLPPSLDPGFSRSNDENRVLLSGRADLSDQFSPELLVLRSDSETRLGANLAHGVGRAIVLYGEWSGGRSGDLTAQALAFGKAVGTLPADLPPPLPEDGGRRWRNQLAVGGSWTSSAAELTVNLEYHLDQASFSGADWRHWFTGAAPGPLWYIRAFAGDRQEPISRRQVFLRADATNAFLRDVELSGFALVDAEDGSALAQLAASYYLSEVWTIGALANASLGGRRSDHGSAPQAGGAILQLQRYF